MFRDAVAFRSFYDPRKFPIADNAKWQVLINLPWQALSVQIQQ